MSSMPQIGTSGDRNKTPEKVSLKSRFKLAVKEHGAPLTIYWAGTYALSGVALYLLVESYGPGMVLDTINQVDYLHDNLPEITSWEPRYLNMGAAFCANEVLELVRMPVVLLSYPILRRVYDRYVITDDQDRMAYQENLEKQRQERQDEVNKMKN